MLASPHVLSSFAVALTIATAFTAPALSQVLPASVVNWKVNTVTKIKSFIKYPASAKKSCQSGIAIVRFTVDGKGRVLQAGLYQSSGFAVLDAEALRAVRHAAPFLALPPDFSQKPAEFNLPVSFLERESHCLS